MKNLPKPHSHTRNFAPPGAFVDTEGIFVTDSDSRIGDKTKDLMIFAS
jgi:hypothetical protein